MRPLLTTARLPVAVMAWLLLLPLALADISCGQAEALASSFLNQMVGVCTLDRSQCAAATSCGNCIDGGDQFGASCVDGCTYSMGDYTVLRSTGGVSGRAFLVNNEVFLNHVGWTHTFTSGAQGTAGYFFEPAIQTEGGTVTIQSAFAGSCAFTFNDNDCLCEQRYCDANQETAANYIDCSSFEGGSVVDFCRYILDPTLPLPQLNDESPLMDILYFLPFSVCQAPAAPAPAPTPDAAAPTPDAALAPTPDVDAASAPTPDVDAAPAPTPGAASSPASTPGSVSSLPGGSSGVLAATSGSSMVLVIVYSLIQWCRSCWWYWNSSSERRKAGDIYW